MIAQPGVTLYSQNKINYMLYNNQGNNTIIDGFSIDGRNDGLGNAHSQANDKCIWSNKDNMTINNMKVFNTYQGGGVYLEGGASYTTLNNIKTFNHGYFGIAILGN